MPGLAGSRGAPAFDWAFWLQWVLATTLGWIVGWAVTGELAVGAVIGIAQWLVLRPQVHQAGWWILASTIGWAMGTAVVMVVFPPEPGVLAGALLGAMIGLAQWFVLRRWVRQAGWWPITSMLGWTIGLTGIMGASLTGAVVGAVTATALELLFRYTRRP